MKKSELTQLTQIIECLVAKEVRKQLPTIIAETFQNMMGNKVVIQPEPQPLKEEVTEPVEADPDEFKASLRELFEGVTPVKMSGAPQQRTMKQYTKNPVLNQILNDTVPDLRQRERSTGMAAFQGGYNPAATAPSEIPPQVMAPRSAPILREGQESSHAPMATLPEGLSALDVARSVEDPNVSKALTRNYSHMMKLIDQKKGKKV